MRGIIAASEKLFGIETPSQNANQSSNSNLNTNSNSNQKTLF